MKTLFQFAKQNCSNIDGADCIQKDSKCLLSEGKPCEYFKDALWPDVNPSYQYATQTNLFPALRDEFALVFGRVQVQEIRRCVCGKPLKKRHRFCGKCRRLNRQKTWRTQKGKLAG